MRKEIYINESREETRIPIQEESQLGEVRMRGAVGEEIPF